MKKNITVFYEIDSIPFPLPLTLNYRVYCYINLESIVIATVIYHSQIPSCMIKLTKLSSKYILKHFAKTQTVFCTLENAPALKAVPFPFLLFPLLRYMMADKS